MQKYLQVFITPERSVQLEWENTEDKISQATENLQDKIFSDFRSNNDLWLLVLGFCLSDTPISPSLNYLRIFSQSFVNKLQKTPDLETLRDNIAIPITENELTDFLDSVPIMSGAEYINRDFIENLWERIGNIFVGSIKTFDGSVEAFIRTFRSDIHLIGRVYFHLVENKDGDAPFAFLATYSTQLNNKGLSRHLPLKFALQEYRDDNEKLLQLLSTVYLAAEKSSFVKTMIDSGELFHPLSLSSDDAYTFLVEIPLYESCGILCRIPNWWKGKKSSVKIDIELGEKTPTFVGLDAILSFNPSISIGGIKITRNEAKKLLAESEGLAFIKGKWVPVDPEKLKQALALYEKLEVHISQGLTIREVMQIQLNPSKLTSDDNLIGLTNGKWLESVVKKLRNPDLTAKVALNKDFTASLRAYQEKGVNWLFYLHKLNLGACLADDMGLGKTIQLLAFLNTIIATDIHNASLLILPASLISNWISEITKFYPKLSYFIAHPGFHTPKTTIEPDTNMLDSFDIVITTYSLAQRYQWIQSYKWRYIILDEAQAIKNPNTKQSKSIKKLEGVNRIVMTGTPIENRLSDLWSLFDFLNPGLLGTSKEFSDFSKPLKKDPIGYQRLRKIISPFILRRQKTDKSIISDLPDKVEIKTFAELSKKQTVLYNQALNELKKILENVEGIQRKGVILSTLMKFKQLCNHSDQYLGTGNFEEIDSGKFSRLREICETVYEKREKILIFTQFKEMTEPLAGYLAGIFNREGLILHGSVQVKKRKDLVDRFQSDDYVPFMVLSLKAGGVGLNLTSANHVVHFDRWWNPAVENQATDRAFRIGQKKNVMVHKFITVGTIEEKIDNMIEHKKALSENIVASSGEAWITEMNNEELMNLFALQL